MRQHWRRRWRGDAGPERAPPRQIQSPGQHGAGVGDKEVNGEEGEIDDAVDWI